MQASFYSQYSTVDSLAYNIADRMDDSRNPTNVRRQLEDFIRFHRSDRLPRNVLKVLKDQIKTLFEQQFEHDFSSSRNRRQTQPMRQQPQQQVIPLIERSGSQTRLEVYDPRHMMGQAELRRSQSQGLGRLINHHLSPLSASRVSQPRQQHQPILIQLDSSHMAPLSEHVSRSMRQERPIQINAQSHPRSILRSPSNEAALQRNSQSVQVNFDGFRYQGETKMKRISSKNYWKLRNEPLVTPHAIYNQKSSEPLKAEKEEPVHFQRQKSSNGQHFWENRKNTLTSEEILRFNSKNKSAQRH